MPGDSPTRAHASADSGPHAPADPATLAVIARAMALLPSAAVVMTSAFEEARAGARILGLCPCATEPLLVCVALRKGHAIEPLIRDSRAFCLCLIRPDDKLLKRKFPERDAAHPASPDHPPAHAAGTQGSGSNPGAPAGGGGGGSGAHAGGYPADAESDPFDAIPVETLVTGCPCIKRSIAVLDCEVVRHLDLEADCELFVGQVLSARVYDATAEAHTAG